MATPGRLPNPACQLTDRGPWSRAVDRIHWEEVVQVVDRQLNDGLPRRQIGIDRVDDNAPIVVLEGLTCGTIQGDDERVRRGADTETRAVPRRILMSLPDVSGRCNCAVRFGPAPMPNPSCPWAARPPVGTPVGQERVPQLVDGFEGAGD